MAGVSGLTGISGLAVSLVFVFTGWQSRSALRRVFKSGQEKQWWERKRYNKTRQRNKDGSIYILRKRTLDRRTENYYFLC